MAELKTKKTAASVEEFLAEIDDQNKRKDAKQILAMMQEITSAPGAMWGPSIIGFGSYTYVYKDGRTLDWFLTGFSPRKQNFSLYIMNGFSRYDDILKDLGKYKTGKSCLYIKRLSDVDQEVLRSLIQASVDHLNKKSSVQ